MGNFSSRSFSFSKKRFILDDQTFIDYKKGFEDFSLVIVKYKILLENCYWIFIPGPGDACICNRNTHQLTQKQFLGCQYWSNLQRK